MIRSMVQVHYLIDDLAIDSIHDFLYTPVIGIIEAYNSQNQTSRVY